MRALIRLLPLILAFSVADVANAAGQGRFVVKAPTVESSEWRDEARAMQDSGTLQELAQALNEIFVLPRNIAMRYVECGEANAYYDAEAYEIQMCLELMEDMAESLEGQFEDEEAEADALAGAYIATLLHEVGHALVHVLEIPVTGREEDAVDQLSAWMLIEADDVDSVLGVAATYYNDDEVGDEDYGDEHSLDKQRYYNLVCWAYGSAPDDSAELIEVWELPEARAEQCVDEYAQLDRSWSRLLQANLRDMQQPVARAPNSGAVPVGSKTGTPIPIVGKVKAEVAPKGDSGKQRAFSDHD